MRSSIGSGGALPEVRTASAPPPSAAQRTAGDAICPTLSQTSHPSLSELVHRTFLTDVPWALQMSHGTRRPYSAAASNRGAVLRAKAPRVRYRPPPTPPIS